MTKHDLGAISVFVINIEAVFLLPWGRPSHGTGWGHAANSPIRGTCRLCARPPWHFRSGKATLACLLVLDSHFSITLHNRICLFQCLFQVGKLLMFRQRWWTCELMQWHTSAVYTSNKGNIARKALLKEQARFKAWQHTPVIKRLAEHFNAGDLAKQVDIPAV
jgi:hypothetical protein